jgi:hypothetical protein
MIEYKIDIISVRIADFGNFKDVIRQINYNLTGTENNQTFTLSHKVVFDSFDENNFTTFQNVTKEQAVQWVEASPDFESIKAHVKIVVDRMVAENALKESPLPWAPPSDSSNPA